MEKALQTVVFEYIPRRLLYFMFKDSFSPLLFLKYGILVVHNSC